MFKTCTFLSDNSSLMLDDRNDAYLNEHVDNCPDCQSILRAIKVMTEEVRKEIKEEEGS